VRYAYKSKSGFGGQHRIEHILGKDGGRAVPAAEARAAAGLFEIFAEPVESAQAAQRLGVVLGPFRAVQELLTDIAVFIPYRCRLSCSKLVVCSRL
jgi:hypothetical protein